ncbi:hypothetical protein C7972_11871 [Arenibacter sp. ARW7G5Y1]|nr:hypothetical protein C7972_11871 [Arenibacter sp. ARW7G5Y1]
MGSSYFNISVISVLILLKMKRDYEDINAYLNII